MTTAFAPPPEMPAWIGSYRILDRIAEGGMGVVYRALDTASSHLVALKTPRGPSPAESTGIRREVATLRRLQHPGIVRMFGDGDHEGSPFIAMELLEGHTLLAELDLIWAGTRERRGPRASTSRLRDETPTLSERAKAAMTGAPPVPGSGLPPAAAGRLGEIASIVAELATVLDYVHAQQLVHRDVKPSNIFLRSTRSPLVTLLDFGLTCEANRARPLGGRSLCVGTMQYAAPEQIIGDPVDARADIYSLGCILYELVTGIPPFEGSSSHDVARQHLCSQPVPPSSLVSGLPWGVEDLLMEMLAKKPAGRPASAGAAAERLLCLIARARRRAQSGGRRNLPTLAP